jgi:hypothetical protein
VLDTVGEPLEVCTVRRIREVPVVGHILLIVEQMVRTNQDLVELGKLEQHRN